MGATIARDCSNAIYPVQARPHSDRHISHTSHCADCAIIKPAAQVGDALEAFCFQVIRDHDGQPARRYWISEGG